MFAGRGAASAVRVRGAPQAPVAARVAPLWCAMPRGHAWAAQNRGDIEGIEQGTFLAKHSVRRSGMRNAGKTIDGEKIDEAIR
ncbi:MULTISPECIES: hypothetical protein [unclassified Burkholderia]|uniref:hypothetical protein n=1 Tax=unclassified Burkholderia TaxID=2613784 RepID=UPI0015C5C1C0|nr:MULTISPECIES: hypothetical protein [unclassified Burkholderia]